LAADAAIPVVADVARRSDVPVFLVGLGSVAPLRSVTVTSRIDGQLLKLGFADGHLSRFSHLRWFRRRKIEPATSGPALAWRVRSKTHQK